MARKLKSGIAASVIAVAIATAGITTVTSFTHVPEAQAWSIKKAYKKTTRVVKRKARIAKEVLSDGSAWKETYSYGTFKEAYVGIGKGAYKYGKRGVKKTTFSAKGAGILAVDAAKRADRRISKATGSYARCLKQRNCGRIGNPPRGTKGFNTHDHRG